MYSACLERFFLSFLCNFCPVVRFLFSNMAVGKFSSVRIFMWSCTVLHTLRCEHLVVSGKYALIFFLQYHVGFGVYFEDIIKCSDNNI